MTEEEAIRRCDACTVPNTCSELGHCPLDVTPGQIAYEAYVEHFNSKSVCNEDWPTWRDLDLRTQGHWRAVAEAIAERVGQVAGALLVQARSRPWPHDGPEGRHRLTGSLDTGGGPFTGDDDDDDDPEYAQSTTACCPRETIPDSCSCPDGCQCLCRDCDCCRCPDCGRGDCTGEDCYWPDEAGLR